MSIKYLLDTHTWIWWNMLPQNLSRKVKILTQNEDGYDELSICSKPLVNFDNVDEGALYIE